MWPMSIAILISWGDFPAYNWASQGILFVRRDRRLAGRARAFDMFDHPANRKRYPFRIIGGESVRVY